MKMVQLKRILENFTALLRNRNIKVPYYDELLGMTDDELVLYLASLPVSSSSDLNILRAYSDESESNLSTVVNVDGVKVIIYWSQTTGKTFMKSEVMMLRKAMKILNAQYVFVMCLYDKLITNKETDIEVFNYTDCLINILNHAYGVKSVSVQTSDQFENDNPLMVDAYIPEMYKNDYLVRYAGAGSGEILRIVRYSILPTMMQDEELAFRRVKLTKDKEIDVATGVYYNL
jgi:DNA-directed RNA polymerase subunit H (RpoH/RPB5)